MQPSQVADSFISRAQAEVVGVSQNDAGTQGFQVLRVQGLDRPLRAHGHENGGGYIPVRKVQGAQSRAARVRGGQVKAHRS